MPAPKAVPFTSIGRPIATKYSFISTNRGPYRLCLHGGRAASHSPSRSDRKPLQPTKGSSPSQPGCWVSPAARCAECLTRKGACSSYLGSGHCSHARLWGKGSFPSLHLHAPTQSSYVPESHKAIDSTERPRMQNVTRLGPWPSQSSITGAFSTHTRYET